jgi:hypothetical protein
VSKTESTGSSALLLAQEIITSSERSNESKRTKWISMNVPTIEEKIHINIRIHFKEATIEIDAPFTPHKLLQVMQTVKKL